jgi:hypothetical protein
MVFRLWAIALGDENNLSQSPLFAIYHFNLFLAIPLETRGIYYEKLIRNCHTKSVEYRLHIRTGTHATPPLPPRRRGGKGGVGGINNQSLITGFSITFIFGTF